MFHGTVSLYLSVSAVVVGNQQTFRGDELAGASAAEQDYGIFQRSLVDAVDIFGCQSEALGLHVSDTLRYE